MGEGVIHGKDLPVGSYEAYEIDAPEASIEVFKYDGQTKEPLKGATFEIRKDSQVIQTVTTDANGGATVGELAKGYYQVVEINAPEGYLVDPIPREVYIDPATDLTSIVRKVSVPKGGLIIRKVDSKTREPLQGVEFKITTASGEFVSTNERLTSSNGVYVTDLNGEIVLNKL